MIPIRDHNPSQITPFVTYGLILINVAVFLLYLPLAGDPEALAAFVERWAVVPAEVTEGERLETFITHMFLHAGLLHLAVNMLFLSIFGNNMEEAFGRIGFLGLYFVSGIAAALAQIALAPDSTIPMIGASGAVAGVLGGYLLLFPRAWVDLLVWPLVLSAPAWLVLGLWFALQVFGGLATMGEDGGGVAFAAHAGGFVMGLLLTVPIWLSRGGAKWWEQSQGRPQNPSTAERKRD